MVGGSGLRPRLPEKSRLKTAPTIYSSIMNLQSFLFDLTGLFLAGGWAEPLNPEPLNLEPILTSA